MRNKFWKITSMNVATKEINGFQQVVLDVGWQHTVMENNEHAVIYGSVTFAPPEKNYTNFVEFSNLTEEIVLDWIYKNNVDKQVIEQKLDQQMDKLLNPEMVSVKLPWAIKTNQES